MHILMVAAENGALAGGKVGGMGDVLRDLPRAVAELGHDVTVLMPSYGHFHRAHPSVELAPVHTRFRGQREQVRVFRVEKVRGSKRVRTLLLEHPLFSVCGRGTIYCNDSDGQPFGRDSEKFALFSAAVADALLAGALGAVDVLHLHDWHVGTVATLLRQHPRYTAAPSLRIVTTIHNLALQGIRPLDGNPASLYEWFPDLPVSPLFTDPRYPNCYNPLRAALNFSDQVNTVSKTYVEEICDPEKERGEGLGEDLLRLKAEGRLHGILNGCAYPKTLAPVQPREDFLELARRTLLAWMAEEPVTRSVHSIALERLWERMSAEDEPRHQITCIGRLTDQKLGLLAQPMADGRTALEHMLERMDEDEELLVLGSGQADIEALLTRAMATDPRVLFLRGYSDPLSEQLYGLGSLFLMPSLFEPCGIAQMLAMRAGQPCLVNHTGGLADTVIDEVNGFVFRGQERDDLAVAMVRRFDQALTRLRRHTRKYQAIRKEAAAARFRWKHSAKAYLQQLYT